MSAKPIVRSRAAGGLVLPRPEVKLAREKRKPATGYPLGSIGADLLRRDYISYLCERYFQFREVEASFGSNAGRRVSYATLFDAIEGRFKAPTYFLPVGRFDELVDYLHRKIESTALGKQNRALGSSSFETFDEFQLTAAGE